MAAPLRIRAVCAVSTRVVRGDTGLYALRVLARTWIVLAIVLLPTSALAQARAYRGPHPIDLEGHWDLEDELHVHVGLVVGEEPFVEVDGALLFLGDPVAYGWEREVWIFRGAHPLPGGLHGYCGLTGDHAHPFAPEGAFRQESGGAYVFAGGMRGGLPMLRPARVAPRHPIVVAEPAIGPVGSTYWWGGCLRTVIVGVDGAPVGICGPSAGVRPRARAPAPPPPRPYFDGRYTGTAQPQRARAPARSSRAVQR